MSKPRYEIVRLDEIERRDNWIPIRERLGIEAFGVNAYVRSDEGNVISPHTEDMSGHEELYVVLDGEAQFTVAGEELSAPAGTIVFVRDPSSRRGATGDATVLALGGRPGGAYEVLDWEGGWQFNRDAMRLYREQRYADAAQVLREGIAEHPDHPGMHYNLACFAALAGETDESLEHLRRAVELYPRFRESARADDDFAPVRDDPRFEQALA